MATNASGRSFEARKSAHLRMTRRGLKDNLQTSNGGQQTLPRERPSGSISASKDVLDSTLPSAIAPTIYARSGDISAAVIVAAAIIIVIRRRRRISFVKVEWC
jgi:hypothetical protein